MIETISKSSSDNKLHTKYMAMWMRRTKGLVFLFRIHDLLLNKKGFSLISSTDQYKASILLH